MDYIGLGNLLSGALGAVFSAFATVYFVIHLQKLKVAQGYASTVYKGLAKFLGELESFRQGKDRFCKNKEDKIPNPVPSVALLESKILLEMTLNTVSWSLKNEFKNELDEILNFVDNNYKKENYASEYLKLEEKIINNIGKKCQIIWP